MMIATSSVFIFEFPRENCLPGWFWIGVCLQEVEFGLEMQRILDVVGFESNFEILGNCLNSGIVFKCLWSNKNILD